MQLNEQVRETLEANGQSHLVAFWDELSDEQQARLEQQIRDIDFELVTKLIDKRDAQARVESGGDRARRAQPPQDLVRLPGSTEDVQALQQAEQAGLELLRQGKVGAILVAGGQGSRLGFDLPKGMYPIGPVSERTLFQILCEQLLARSRQAGVAIPYFIMTSEATHSETVAFFEQNEFFGLGEENVFYFQQASLPAIDDSSHRLLLAEKGRIATSPDGHGGMLRALEKHGMLDVMRQRGIEHLYYHQVDNPTAIVCDPVLLGLHLTRHSDLTTKVVAKVSPEEKMGVLVTVDGHTEIIEYSDLPGDEAYRQDASGQDVFWAGNTAIHVFRRDFIESLLDDDLSLPFHIAHKKIPCVDESGSCVEPETPNGNKFEQFIFDALPHARVALVVEGDRAREFNPVKNADGNDSPQTSRAAMLRIAREWIRACGGQIDDSVEVEISPLFALDEQQLAEKLEPGQTFSTRTVLSVTTEGSA